MKPKVIPVRNMFNIKMKISLKNKGPGLPGPHDVNPLHAVDTRAEH
jgi:hypothetical protein